MPSMNFSGSIGTPVSAFPLSESVDGDVGIDIRPVTAVPVAKTGSLTTRTDDDTGVVAAATGHGITTGQKVDLYWSGGSRLSMDATVSGDDITLDGGDANSDVLPAAATAVTLMAHAAGASESAVFTPAGLQAMVFYTNVQGAVHFYESNGTTLIDSFQIFAGLVYYYMAGISPSNPLTGTSPAIVKMTHSDSASAISVQGYILANS